MIAFTGFLFLVLWLIYGYLEYIKKADEDFKLKYKAFFFIVWLPFFVTSIGLQSGLSPDEDARTLFGLSVAMILIVIVAMIRINRENNENEL